MLESTRCELYTLTESASDKGLERSSFPKTWATNSTTGSGSMNAFADISDQYIQSGGITMTSPISVEV